MSLTEVFSISGCFSICPTRKTEIFDSFNTPKFEFILKATLIIHHFLFCSLWLKMCQFMPNIWLRPKIRIFILNNFLPDSSLNLKFGIYIQLLIISKKKIIFEILYNIIAWDSLFWRLTPGLKRILNPLKYFVPGTESRPDFSVRVLVPGTKCGAMRHFKSYKLSNTGSF